MSDRANQLLEEIVQRVKDILNAETAVVAEVEEEEVLYYAAAVGKHAQVIKGKRGAIRRSLALRDRYFWFVWDGDRG